MAEKSLLYKEDLEEFKHWLVNQGYVIEECKGIFEILRARKNKLNSPLIIFYRERGVRGRETKQENMIHYTVQDKDVELVRQFYQDKKNKN